MSELKKYRRKEKTTITAVRLDLETDGFSYKKWGGTQSCKAGDWIVENAGEIYTVDAAAFERTYQAVSPGRYEKVGVVWAEQVSQAGSIPTKEGATDFAAGDFLVYNEPQRRDGYAMTSEKFHSLYELAS